MEYIQIFIDWFMEVLVPNITKNFEELINLIMGLFGDFDLGGILPEA